MDERQKKPICPWNHRDTVRFYAEMMECMEYPVSVKMKSLWRLCQDPVTLTGFSRAALLGMLTWTQTSAEAQTVEGIRKIKLPVDAKKTTRRRLGQMIQTVLADVPNTGKEVQCNG